MQPGKLATMFAMLLMLAGCSVLDNYGPQAKREPGPSTADGAPTGVSVGLTARSNSWTPASMRLGADAPVVVTVENADGAQHSFTLADADVDANIPPGQTVVVEFVAPPAGTYTFVCKYHAGMQGTAAVA